MEDGGVRGDHIIRCLLQSRCHRRQTGVSFICCRLTCSHQVCYIYFTRIIVYLIHTTVDYRYEWVSDAASEMATLAFYVWTAVNFQPTESNPYLKLSDGEKEVQL